MNNNELDFRFSQSIQVRWNDLDALGHVNNAVFVSYFEIARGYYMPAACKNWDWRKDMFLIANVNVDYKKELPLTAKNVTVYVKTANIGNKSFVLNYALTSENNGEITLHATGSTTQIMFDMKNRSTIEIATNLREALTNFDGL